MAIFPSLATAHFNESIRCKPIYSYFRVIVIFFIGLTRNLGRHHAPHFANVDLPRSGGPENGSGSRVSNQHAPEHSDRLGPTREDRNDAGASR